MKKTLILFASGIIVGSGGLTAACQWNNGTYNYRNNMTDQVVNFAGLAARAGILSTFDDIDPTYTSDYYGDQKVSILFPGLFQKWAQQSSKLKANTTIYDEMDLLFGSEHGYAFTNKGTNHEIKFDGTHNPIDKSFASNFSTIQSLLYILQGGFSYSSINQLAGLFSSNQFSGAISDISKYTPDMTVGLLSGLGKSFDMTDFLPADSTYQNLMEGEKVLFANFLNSLRAIPEAYVSEAQKKIIGTPNLEAADKLMGDAILDIINGKTASDMQKALLSEHGIPTLLKFVVVLGDYINEFNRGHGTSSPTLYLKDDNIQDSDHLFQTTLNNYQVLTSVLKSKYTPSKNISLENVIGTLNLFFTADTKNDSKGYNLEKLFAILFNNKKVNNKVVSYNGVGSLPELTISYAQNDENNAWGFDQVLIPAYLGAGKILKSLSELVPDAVIEKLSSIIYTLFFEFANNKPNLNCFANYLSNGTEGGIVNNSIIKLAARFVPKIKKYLTIIVQVSDALRKYHSNLPTMNHGIWQDLYKGDLMTYIFNEINTFVGPDTIAPSTIQLIPNISGFLTTKVSTIYTTITKNTLPNYLYITQEKSINDIIKDTASEVGITDQNKYIRSPNHKAQEYKKYGFDRDVLNHIFSAMGQTADKSIAAATVAGVNPKYLQGVKDDPKTTSTLAYALDLFGAKTDIGGINSGFNLLGLNAAKNDIWKNSFFDHLNQLDIKPTTSPGLPFFFTLINKVFQALNRGMQDNAKYNFSTYLKATNWKIPNDQIHQINSKTLSLISFNLHYTDPVKMNPKTHQHYHYLINISLTIKLNSSSSYYSWTKWNVEVVE